jgi:hypothetical protein
MTIEQIDSTTDRILAKMASQLSSGRLSSPDYARELASLKRHAAMWYTLACPANPRHPTSATKP